MIGVSEVSIKKICAAAATAAAAAAVVFHYSLVGRLISTQDRTGQDRISVKSPVPCPAEEEETRNI